MFGKVFLKPAGIFKFLILYISVTSATPTGQPGEAQNINDDILARAYKPYQCKDPYIWTRRECKGPFSPRAWQDVCAWTPWENPPITRYQNEPGICPPGTTCLDSKNEDNRSWITCISDDNGKGKRKIDPQGGTSELKSARRQLGNTQLELSVTIDHDMTDAAVAAVVKSDDGSFLIAPNNILVGNLRGYQEKVCNGNKRIPTMARECYPNGLFDFKKGDVIDFTWGMTDGQEGRVVYGIIPYLNEL